MHDKSEEPCSYDFKRSRLCDAVKNNTYPSADCCDCAPGYRFDGSSCVLEDECHCRDPITNIVYPPMETWDDINDPYCIHYSCVNNKINTFDK